jgi:hypothetical protein
MVPRKGYTVWLDNFYNSPVLAMLLKDKNIDCVWSLKVNMVFPEQ